MPLSVLAGELLDECGDRDYLLRFYSRGRLFSDEPGAAGCRPIGARSPGRNGHDGRESHDVKPITFSCEETLAIPPERIAEQILDLDEVARASGATARCRGSGRRSSRPGRPRSSAPASG